MEKKIKIKEIAPKVKVIREIGKDDLEDLAEDKVKAPAPAQKVEQPVMMNFGGSRVKVSPVLQNTEGSNVVRQNIPTVQAPRKEEREKSGAQLYNTGRGMGSEREGQRKNYQAAQQARVDSRTIAEGARTIAAQRGPLNSAQGGAQRSAFDEANSLSERKYDGVSDKEKKERRVGPWE